MLVNLTPAVLDLKLYAGDSTAVTVHVISKVTKLSVDLSDRTWASQWRRKRTAETAVDLTVDDTDAANGVLVVHFPGTLEPAGVWDLEGTHAITQAPATILTGDVTMEPDVTRP